MIDPLNAMTAVAAVLAGTSAYSIGAWRYNLHWKRVWRTHADDALELFGQEVDARIKWRSIAIDLGEKLLQIERQRSNNTRKGNATKAAKAKALRDAKTSELRRDLQASLSEERLAA